MNLMNLAIIVLCLIGLAAIGLGSANPGVMVPSLLVFFALVFWVIYLFTKKHSHAQGELTETKKPGMLSKLLTIAGWLLLLACLSLIGMGSATPNTIIPLLFVFFLVVFGLVYLGVRKSGASVSSNDSRKVTPLSRFLKTVGVLIAWGVMLLALSMMCLGAKDRQTVIPLAFLFFLVVFAGVFLYTRKHSHSDEADPKTTLLWHRIIGIVLIVLSMLVPLQVIHNITGEPISAAILIALGVGLVLLGGVSVMLINKFGVKFFGPAIIGYILLILTSLVPAWAVSQLNTTGFSVFGTAYFGAFIMAILSWWGASLCRKPEEN